MICNRGVAVLEYTNKTVCFCPPSYYGQYCEYHSDRVTIYTHLNVSHSRFVEITIDSNITIKLLALLVYENEILHNRQFHFRSVDNFHRIIKKRCHLIYSREKNLLQTKIHRRLSRTSITNHTPYYLRYEAYELTENSSIHLVGVWQYPIYFDFLPSFRIAKVLRFHNNLLHSLCHPNPCNSSNAECHILQNDPEKFICLCKPRYSGKNCSILDEYCAKNFCHSKSLCKPTYLGKTAGTRLPYCLCPLNMYGSRCGLVLDQCWNNPCKNNGTCYSSTSDLNKTKCACVERYYGDNCESKREDTEIQISPHNVSGIFVIQYLDINFKTLDLILGHQVMVKQLFERLRYEYPGRWAPSIILVRSYSSGDKKYPKIFLLSLMIGKKFINSSASLEDTNTCLNIKDISMNISGLVYENIFHIFSTFSSRF
ncbi:unnamed protein product [Adineta steineri]|uniref:EGF-like domain-containing protein n=1 Tax=Adineta steineri TaxID=433720 RepID=A0A814QBR3_9BILA|nr:unnamed protein product [Adineta steineri]CAF4058964.1 unnamed protein product [Adineta steineri]